MRTYDLLIVGAGLFGSVIANVAKSHGKKVLIVEKREHIGGNCYTKTIEDINIHVYGAHIFRTNDVHIWNYLEQFCEFNNFINTPIANYRGELYNMPFNMNTYHALWGVNTPMEARRKIKSQCIECACPRNLEEHILSIAGTDIYEKLVKGYTEKQWGRPCNELPISIMRRIPLRFVFNNNYFNDRYQGVPIGGYTPIFEKLLHGCDIELSTDYLESRSELEDIAELTVYTGPIDAFYDYRFGPLSYRSLRFDHELLSEKDHQGVAVVNYTDSETPYTRIIEHKHFEFGTQNNTVISYEYPQDWHVGMEPYYPLEDSGNQRKYNLYKELANETGRVRFGGRLGEYRYYDMQDTVRSAMEKAKQWGI